MNRIARCDCGKLQVVCAGDPTFVSRCHCLACQRRTGSTFGIAAFFVRSDVSVKGESTLYRRGSDSGFAVTFHFCRACGSTVYWEAERKPDMMAVAVGAFGDRDFPAPGRSVYDEHRHHWIPEHP